VILKTAKSDAVVKYPTCQPKAQRTEPA